jgi:hypothetical protein
VARTLAYGPKALGRVNLYSGHHEHRPTGKTGHCATEGCRASWPVLCHGHNRRYCASCGHKRERARTREAERTERWHERLGAEDRRELVTDMAIEIAETGEL